MINFNVSCKFKDVMILTSVILKTKSIILHEWKSSHLHHYKLDRDPFYIIEENFTQMWNPILKTQKCHYHVSQQLVMLSVNRH